jgi:hypothetical protein
LSFEDDGLTTAAADKFGSLVDNRSLVISVDVTVKNAGF